jgi:serine/threonine-protein kinase RsbW
MERQQTISREFTFPGNSESMVAARESVMDFIRENGANETEEIDIFLALQEALANAVLHGCKNDGTKRIRCCIEIDPSAFVIVVRDPGPGFDVPSTEAADLSANLTGHGRGISLMRSLMNDISYVHGGSEVRLRKLRELSNQHTH